VTTYFDNIKPDVSISSDSLSFLVCKKQFAEFARLG